MQRSVSSLPRARQSGFTIIEVLIVVAIIGVLAGIALPAYGDYIRRGQLPEAFAGMSDLRVKMEQYYQDNRNYGAAQCADAGPPSWSQGNGTLNYQGAQFFGFTCALTGGGQGYTITANGTSGRAVGHTYTINHSNQRGTTLFKNVAVTNACWLTRGGEC